MFKRRDGTAGISGHLYETKLLSLLYFRALHDDTIKEFQLASNVDNIGAFDDICFRATVRKHDKPICVFIQGKHRENKRQTLKIDLSTYFISYLKIREHFDPSNNDLFFGCKFDETECYFVIYTTARYEFSNDSKVKSSLCSNLHDVIDTGGTAKPYNLREDTEFLCEIAIKEHMASLAERMAMYVMGEKQFQMMLTTELMKCYHVILAQKVVDVSEKHSSQSQQHRIATFRHDFFNTNDKYLTVFKDTLYKEIVKKKKIAPIDNIKSLLPEFLAETTDAEKLSKLIGPVIKYNKGVLQINKQYSEYVGPQQLNEVNVSPETVKQAVELAAKEILLSPELNLKVPAAFGNKDLTVKPRRINHLESVITGLLDKCKYSKIVTIDESLGDGFLELNGGIAGAVGNFFVLDDNPKLMKVTSDENSLGTFAKSLYRRLNDKIELTNNNRTDDKIPDLCEYKFCFKFKECPKLLLECSEYEENLARDFLDKLLIYSGQADEKDVEDKLKDEIEENLDHNDYLQAKTEPMFLKYHDEMQKWWMLQNEAPYLNRDSQILKKAASYITEDPLMSDISVKHMSKILQYNYTFTEDAVRSLNLQDQRSSTIIVAVNILMTVVKVFQHLILQNKEHVMLDLEYIVNLPRKKRNALRRELTNTEKVLILVCNNIPNNETITFKNVAEAVRNKRTIIITNSSFKKLLQKYFGTADDRIVHDDRNSLNDMREESQRNILATGKVKFQGMEVELEPFVKGWTPDDDNLGRIL